MVLKVLEALTARSYAQDLNRDNAITGPNTECDSEFFVEHWQEWKGFTYKNLANIFKEQLRRPYTGEVEPRPLPPDLCIVKEDSAQDAVGRFPIPIVNYALASCNGTEHFGRGSRCLQDERFMPDWSVISKSHRAANGGPMNILPGDSKVSSKWWSTMVTDSPNNFVEWQKVVHQVVTYIAMWRVRYGFIVTDAEVVVLRITREYVHSGLAAHRPRRQLVSSGGAAAILSSDPLPSDPSSVAPSEGYEDNNPLRWDFGVEYKAVPWSAHREGELTGKLALWALARMSAYGDNHIDYSYPDLNTWRTQDGGDGHRIVHNTSGEVRHKATKETKIQQPNHYLQHVLAAAPSDPAPSDPGAEYFAGEDLYGDDRAPQEEPQLPQLPQRSIEIPIVRGQPPGSPYETGSEAGTTPRQNKVIEVKVHKRGKEYCYEDYDGSRRKSVKSEWEAVKGGHILRGKRHDYFTKKLP